VQKKDKQSFVWTIKDSVAHKTTVKTGLATDTAQAIVEGLAEGQEVVTGPARVISGLTDGSKVKVKELTL